MFLPYNVFGNYGLTVNLVQNLLFAASNVGVSIILDSVESPPSPPLTMTVYLPDSLAASNELEAIEGGDLQYMWAVPEFCGKIVHATLRPAR